MGYRPQSYDERILPRIQHDCCSQPRGRSLQPFPEQLYSSSQIAPVTPLKKAPASE